MQGTEPLDNLRYFSPNNPEETKHNSPVRARYKMPYLRSYSEQNFSFLSFVMCAISCCIRLRYIKAIVLEQWNLNCANWSCFLYSALVWYQSDLPVFSGWLHYHWDDPSGNRSITLVQMKQRDPLIIIKMTKINKKIPIKMEPYNDHIYYHTAAIWVIYGFKCPVIDCWPSQQRLKTPVVDIETYTWSSGLGTNSTLKTEPKHIGVGGLGHYLRSKWLGTRRFWTNYDVKPTNGPGHISIVF